MQLSSGLNNYHSYTAQVNFCFLNLEHSFSDTIDWNYSAHGKLWTYNLTYFDYLLQNGMDQATGLRLIEDFIDAIETVHDGLEPYPTSLRGINWIKFLSLHNIKDEKIDSSLYLQYQHLSRNLEYHLLGNHLIENGFSLLFGAYYFQNECFYKKAQRILQQQLTEQILTDGGHFERSPMYHKIIIYRLLDSINLVQNNWWKQAELLPLLRESAESMLGFLLALTYRDGTTPHLNDSTDEIAPETEELVQYAHRLEVFPQEKKLGQSGYRKIDRESYECVLDVAPIGPDYIPGHAHADTLSFELRLQGTPFIVDAGISTYEKNDRRHYERSTVAHNTVEVMGHSSSEVWGGFRVAHRAKITYLWEKESAIKTTHNGYKKLGIYHTRSWTFSETKVLVEDQLSKPAQAIFRLHFHPSVNEESIRNHVNTGGQQYSIKEYLYAEGFNRTRIAKVLEIGFTQELIIEVGI